MTQPAPLTSTTFVDGELTNEAKWFARVFTVINWLLGQFGDTGWNTPSLSNSWVVFGTPFDSPQYRRLNGIVYVKGMAKSGTLSTVFTLPAGYQTLKERVFNTASNTGGAQILIVAGAVSINGYYGGGSNAFVSFEFSFPAEQ